LERRLSDADEFIGQNKLLMARLEGEVSETGAEIEETGSVAGKKLDVLESEVRKLWGVAYDRNRKTLKAHDDRLKKLDAVRLKLEKRSSELDAELKALNTGIDKHVKVLDGRVASVSGELSIVRAEQDDSLQALTKRLALLDQRTKEQEKQALMVNETVKVNKLSVNESIAALASIDESRRQLIKRVVDLESRLNDLSLTASNAAANKPK
jgi:chromosome segregation ATPase